jgi:hypothetical protein
MQSYLFRDMACLNDDLKAEKHPEIAPTTFVQEVVLLILLESKKQITMEEARLKSIALILPPDALRALSTSSENDTSDQLLGVCILPHILLPSHHRF